MLVYRTCNKRHVNSLTGQGGLLVEGRWHSKGYEIIYTSSSMALCLLEVLKFFKLSVLPLDTAGMIIEIPDNKHEIFPEENLPENWNNPMFYPDYLQQYGDEWLQQKRSLILKVPSAVVPTDFNYLINPNHADFSIVKIVSINEIIVKNGYLLMKKI